MREKALWRSPVLMGAGAILCCLLWGSAFPCIKIGYRLFGVSGDDSAAQILFAGIRFTLAGVLVILAGSAVSRRWLLPKKNALAPIGVLALFQTAIQYLLFYIGLAHVSGVNSSIITGANAFVTILVACFLFRRETFTLPKLLGCVLGFGGVLLLNLTGENEWAFAFTGEGFVLLATLASAVATVLMKGYSQKADPVMLSGWQFLLGGLVLVGAGLTFGGRLAPEGGAAWWLLLYLGFLSAAAFTLWGILLKIHPVSGMSAYKCTIPLFGVLLSAWWLSERAALWRWQVPAALALVVLGVWVINTRRFSKYDAANRKGAKI